MYAVLPLVLLCFAGALAARRIDPTPGLLLVAYALGTMVAVALPGRFLPHYYQLWLPVLAIGGAWAVSAIPFPETQRPRWQERFALLVALVLLAAQLPYYRLAPQEWSIAKFGNRLPHNRRVAALINELLLPGEAFYQWGHSAELYFYSGRRPPAPELRSQHFLAGPRIEQRSRKLVEDLSVAKPELLLVSQQFDFPLEQEVPRWLMQRYAELKPAQGSPWATAGYRAFCRRGGRLEQRLMNHAADRRSDVVVAPLRVPGTATAPDLLALARQEVPYDVAAGGDDGDQNE